MDTTRVKKIYSTPDQNQANMLLRCNWVLLEVKDGRFLLGQTEKFICPKCDTEIEFDGVNISSWEGLHIIDCINCGKEKIPYGITIDQYFIDRITEFPEDEGLD